MELLQSLIWLLAGIGIFIVGMNFMSHSLEKSAGKGLKNLLEKISNNRFSGVGIGAGVTAIIQSSSATSVMVIGLVNAGVMTLIQATPIIMGANIGTTITGILVALKNDYFNMMMYLLAFVGVMMGFFKKEKLKVLGNLFCGLGLIFVGLELMSSEQAFGNPQVKGLFTDIFKTINFPLLLILVGVIFTALIQSSSAATGIVITMVGTGLLSLDLALFIVLGANIGTCVTALLASVGANINSKRVAFIHFAFNFIGTVMFACVIWLFKEQIVQLLVAMFPNENDPMSLQMRLPVFHVIFNVSTTLLLLPFVKHLVKLSGLVLKDKNKNIESLSLKYVDNRLLTIPPVALMQVKKEIEYMIQLVEENISLSFYAIDTGSSKYNEQIQNNERIINFINKALTEFLIHLSTEVEDSDEKTIGAYFHVLNDLERIGDNAENFHEIGIEMAEKNLAFSNTAQDEISSMKNDIMRMFEISKDVFRSHNTAHLPELAKLEEKTDATKKEFMAKHFKRLAEKSCNVELSPYYSSVITRLERVADHIINVGYSIKNPTGSQE